MWDPQSHMHRSQHTALAVHGSVLPLMPTPLCMYIRACNTTDLHTCSQGATCPSSHVAPSPMHTHARARLPFYMHHCPPPTPHGQIKRPQAHPVQSQIQEQKQGPTQSRRDMPTHAPVKADTHDHVSTDAHMHEHDTCPQLLCTHAQTLWYDRAPNACRARL